MPAITPPHNQLVVGSMNPDKAAEIRAMLGASGLPMEVVSLADCNVTSDVDETGTTFEANAILKATQYAAATGRLTMADDSGLCVDALDGEPGVYSARWAGPGCNYADNNRKLLAALDGKPLAERGAHFICTIACALPDRIAFTVVGRVDGVIATAPRGDRGFGYDPLFIWEPLDRTFAEMSPEQKNGISHRALALRAFRERLAVWLQTGE
ncbi:MAG: RdgB/HAM1 family non-canonical purine NTP pyrophosphatase [Planctomycetota bacterium]